MLSSSSLKEVFAVKGAPYTKFSSDAVLKSSFADTRVQL
ncbi:hypothetical protein JCM19233_6725 [Vibrio astriarenae]|nr:hypothetical protein JCM19233_6725 [Vibrio sp. C7]